MAGDPFLSDPSRKRKRGNRPSSTTRNIRSKGASQNKSRPAENDVDEMTEESESETENNIGSDRELEDMSSDEEFQDENAADKRRRLAKQYLENLKHSQLEDEDFDAKDLDDDIIGRRLQRDVAEAKGQMFKFYASKVSPQIEDSKPVVTRIGSKNLTDMAVYHQYLYTVSKYMELIKWEISSQGSKPQRVKHSKGGSKYFNVKDEVHRNHHCEAINCVAASPDGKFVVTGGNDGRLIIWSSENLSCLKVLDAHSPINSVVFRRNTDQLYAACADLKVRTYSINQFSQLEVLYGHQDNIVDIAALARETCVSVGSRDRTALFWKIAEESRLTFRGGDSKNHYAEGSIECVSMVDETHFVTGSDNGNVSLWSLSKKKPVFTHRLAHGLVPELAVSRASAETTGSSIDVPEKQPYWITAVHAVPFTDIFVSGSYNGELNFWKIDREGLRKFELLGTVQAQGFINKIVSAEFTQDRKLVVYALTSKEHRFGRWSKASGARNALVSFAFSI